MATCVLLLLVLGCVLYSDHLFHWFLLPLISLVCFNTCVSVLVLIYSVIHFSCMFQIIFGYCNWSPIVVSSFWQICPFWFKSCTIGDINLLSWLYQKFPAIVIMNCHSPFILQSQILIFLKGMFVTSLKLSKFQLGGVCWDIWCN